ncbi:MAG: ABC transporter ATP-binding protein [Pseudomonadota bacterium]|nr:ABC transporter ATP-binding protein [Pseudomonadota bacterium]
MLIRTQRLGKVFGEAEHRLGVLEDVSLSIESGEMLAVMGPSGSGKSTLLNILGCLDSPSSGGYWLAGESVAGLGAERLAALRNRYIGFVFQSFNLLPRLTALQNVELPLLYAGVPAAKRRERAVGLLGDMDLTDRAGHFPRQLSGGQQQRVAIARALANRPALILADEPTGSLESRSGEAILALFRRLNRAGVTLLVVTHDSVVAEHAGRIVRLRDGRVVSDQGGSSAQNGAGIGLADEGPR